MALSLNDYILQGTGGPSVNDGLFSWYGTNGGTGNSLQDRAMSFLTSKGYTTGTLQDRWFAYLGSLGYTQNSLQDRLYAFWAAGGVIGGAFGNNAAFSTLLLNGSLSTTSTTDLVNWRSTNGYTVEYWLCPVQYSSLQFAPPGIGNKTGVSTTYWAFGSNNGILDFYFFDGGLKNFRSAAGAIPLNAWTHIAASFTTVGNTTTGEFYINGVRQSMTLTGGVASETPTYTSAATPYNTGTATIFGVTSSSSQFYGYADNVRISSTNRYTGTSFTVPSGPFSDDGDTQLLLVLDEADGSTTFTDESSFARSITNASNRVIASDYRANHSIPTQPAGDIYADDVVMFIGVDEPTNVAHDFSSYHHVLTNRRGPPTYTVSDNPFGNTSKIMRFANDSIDFPVTAVLQNLATYTIEFWMKESAIQTTYSTITGSSPNNTGIYIAAPTINGYTLQYAFGAAPAPVLTSPTALNDNVWRHIACVKDGSTAYLFIDGVLIDTETGISNAYDTAYMSDGQLGGSRFSGGTNSDNYFTGDILDYRITKGVARYTSGFTPATAPIVNPDELPLYDLNSALQVAEPSITAASVGVYHIESAVQVAEPSITNSP